MPYRPSNATPSPRPVKVLLTDSPGTLSPMPTSVVSCGCGASGARGPGGRQPRLAPSRPIRGSARPLDHQRLSTTVTEVLVGSQVGTFWAAVSVMPMIVVAAVLNVIL